VFDPSTGNLGDVQLGAPPELRHGEPLAGGGVGGTMLYSWMLPPPVVFDGWLLNGAYTPTEEQRGLQLRAFYRRVPDWAPESPRRRLRVDDCLDCSSRWLDESDSERMKQLAVPGVTVGANTFRAP
jgi:hypothetical protein